MPVCVLNCFIVYCDLQDKKLVKNMPKIQILSPLEFQIINLVPEYYAETSSMTIYTHIWMKLIFKHAFWPVLGFMVISRTKNWWKISQLCQFWLPESWIFNLEPQYCSKTSPMTIYGHKWLKLICQHAFWPFIGFMIITRTKNWSKIWQKYMFLPPP